MKLLIIRHAHAEERENWNALGKPDELRPLVKKGIFRFADVAIGLMKIVESIETIYTSEYIRSLQTAELLKKGFPMAKLEIAEELNVGANMNQVIEMMSKNQMNKCYALIGHQPELSQLASLLLSGKPELQFRFKKAGAMYLELINNQWNVHWFLNSKQLASIK